VPEMIPENVSPAGLAMVSVPEPRRIWPAVPLSERTVSLKPLRSSREVDVAVVTREASG
jgi:hypothetical protein